MFKNSPIRGQAKFKLTLLILAVLSFFLSYLTVLADESANPLIKQQGDILNQIGGPSGYGQTQSAELAEGAIATEIGEVVGMILSVLGVVFLFLVVYSGIQWMTAGGNEERVTKARARITRAVVGLIIVTTAYALSAFVLSKIQKSAQQNQTSGCSEIKNANACVAYQRVNNIPVCQWVVNENKCQNIPKRP